MTAGGRCRACERTCGYVPGLRDFGIVDAVPGSWDEANQSWVCDACAGRDLEGRRILPGDTTRRSRAEFEAELRSLGLGRRRRGRA